MLVLPLCEFFSHWLKNCLCRSAKWRQNISVSRRLTLKPNDVRVVLYTRNVMSPRFSVNCRYWATSSRLPSTAKSALFICTSVYFDISRVYHFFTSDCRPGCHLLIFSSFLQNIVSCLVLESGCFCFPTTQEKQSYLWSMCCVSGSVGFPSARLSCCRQHFMPVRHWDRQPVCATPWMSSTGVVWWRDHASNQELKQRSRIYASHVRDGESTEIEISWPRAETEDVAMNWVETVKMMWAIKDLMYDVSADLQDMGVIRRGAKTAANDCQWWRNLIAQYSNRNWRS